MKANPGCAVFFRGGWSTDLLRKSEGIHICLASFQSFNKENKEILWFDTKKGKEYVNQQKCEVTAWSMIQATSTSRLTFIVHKKPSTGIWDLEVVN